MFSSRDRVMLAVVVLGYVLLGVVYSAVVPVFEASDEYGHYPLVQYLATHDLQLPVLDAANPGLWRQEGGQPPLYYVLAALGTQSIDTSDFGARYQLNPHADIGRVPPDGNVNIVVHDTAREQLPWSGTVLAVHVARLLSVLMGAVTVLTTFLISREVLPDQPWVAVVAATFNAFLPMFLFISGSVNNDNLSNMLAGLLVWQIIRLLKRGQMPAVATYAVLGILAAAALLAKLSLGFLLLLVAGALFVLSLRLRSWEPVLKGGAISGGLALLGAGWWYLRNWQLYGDATGINVFLDIVGRRTVQADLAQLWLEQESFFRSWWGVFGGMNVLLPDGVYAALNVVGVVGLIAFGVFVLVTIMGRHAKQWQVNGWGLAIVTVWPLVAFGALLQWSSQTWASQGRLLFIAIGPISLWLAIGLGWWLPTRIRHSVWMLLIALLVGVAGLVPFVVIQPAYALPEMQTVPVADLSGGGAEFVEPGGEAPILRLGDVTFQPGPVQPGDSLSIAFDWTVLAQPTRRWSMFVHVMDSVGIITAQRDRYPGQGLLATERLEPGGTWQETVVVDLPETLYSPDTLTIAVGWYDRATGERLSLAATGETFMMLEGEIAVEPRNSEYAISNPRADNFENLIHLTGYELGTRQLKPGDALQVSLRWSAQAAVPRDYTVFVHVIDTETLTIYAGSDAQPVGGARPTSSWQAGEAIVDEHMLVLSADTPPGVYEVEVGLYWMPEAGVFERLNVLAERGGLTNNLVYLSRVAVVAGSD